MGSIAHSHHMAGDARASLDLRGVGLNEMSSRVPPTQVSANQTPTVQASALQEELKTSDSKYSAEHSASFKQAFIGHKYQSN